MKSNSAKKQRGYSLDLYKAVYSADPMHIGVQLGRLCIEKNVPVSKVATDMNVSRLTVYNWFLGKVYPKPDKVQRMTELLAIYTLPSV